MIEISIIKFICFMIIAFHTGAMLAVAVTCYFLEREKK